MEYSKSFLPKNIVLGLLIGFLTACGGTGENKDRDNPFSSGVFIDSPVAGLRYLSGDLLGETDSSGSFQCLSTIQFFVGDILLGEASCMDIITPVDLVADATDPTHPRVTNIARFLQTLDDDDNSSNGIQISTPVAVLAEDQLIDFDQSIEAFEESSAVQILVNHLTSARSAGATDLISSIHAQTHLQRSMWGLLAGTYSGSFSGARSGDWTLVVSNSGSVVGSTVAGDDILGTISTNGTVNFTLGGTEDSSDFSGNITRAGNASGTWSDASASGNWRGQRISTIADTSIFDDTDSADNIEDTLLEDDSNNGGEDCAGSLSISGIDTDSIGNSFSAEKCSALFYEDTLIITDWRVGSTASINNLVVTYDNSGAPEEIALTFRDVADAGNWFYVNKCSELADSCAAVTVDSNTNTVIFSGVALTPVTGVAGNNASGPVTLSGSLAY